ncbi:MAG: amidase [Microthrixaceae bacterium]
MANPNSAVELADQVRRGERTATELLEQHLAGIDRLDPELNAVCLRDDEDARARAAAVDAAVEEGRSDELGPFAGVPMLIKDLHDVAGWPTTYGSRATVHEPAEVDDLAVGRLRAAGFVLSGKTTTPEFGTISVTESELFGATRNPWDTAHTPGGSSGGAAAAVAAGLLPAAHASDGGGSIRIPASCNGLVGLKCSRHRITAAAAKMTGGSTQGIVSRRVVDTAAISDVMAGQDPGAWEVAPPLARPLAQECGADPGRMRIRVSTANAMGIDPAPGCVEAVELAAGILEDLGHSVDTSPVDWPDPGGFLTGFLTVWSTITAGAGPLDEDLLEPHNRENRRAALATSAIAYSEAVMDLQIRSRAFTAQFADAFDLLLTPTMAIEPPPVGWIFEGSDSDPLAPLTNATPMAAYTAVFNVTGQPAISLPVHVSAAGLPVGVQLAAPPFGEAALVRVAAQMEAAVGWHERPLPDPLGG